MASGLITNAGKNLALSRLIGTSQSILAQFKVGTSATAPTATDTDLNNQVPISGTQIVDTCEVATGWTASGTNSVAAQTVQFKIGTAALTLVKSDVTSATASVAKTTSTVASFASHDFWIFVYISASMYANLKASGTALAVIFGLDSSNYYERDFTAAQLSSGWNYIMLNTANASNVVGAPGTTNLAYTKLTYTMTSAATTTSSGDFNFDQIQVASASNYKLNFNTGYPVQLTPTRQLITLGTITTVQANGFPLNETAMFNTDGTPVCWSHDTFTQQIKNNQMAITFKWVDQAV